MALLVQIIVTGLAAGAVYGLVAIGIALIYRLTGVVHLALGELLGLAVFVTLLAAGGAGPVTRGSVPVGRFALALAFGLVAAVAAGLVVDRILRPFLRRGSVLGWVGALVAVAVGIRGLLAAAFPRASYVFPDPLGLAGLGDGGVLRLGGGATVQIRAFVVLAAAVALAAAAARFLERTELGLAFEAVAADELGARVAGVPVEWLRAAAFGLAGLLAALAAILHAPAAPVSVDTGAILGLKGLVAALLAGFGSPWRAFAAGLVLGLVEGAVSGLAFLGPAFRDVVPLGLVVVALLARRGVAPREEPA